MSTRYSARVDPTVVALFVAALTIAASSFNIWLTYRWTRQQERERRTAESETDAAKWVREERKRRVLRGEDAAARLLELADEMAAMGDSQTEMRPKFVEMRRLAELLTDDATRDRLFDVASAYYFVHQALRVEPNLMTSYAYGTADSAAHAVIRAYLHERPLPDLPKFDRLLELQREGSEFMSEMMDDEDRYDPLGPAEPAQTTEQAS